MPKARPKAQPPLEVRLTVNLRFGDEPDEQVNLIDDRAIPMVNSVFESRTAIIKGFAKLMTEGVLLQPKLMKKVFPLLSR
jgi:hypothetical protein